MDLFKTREGGVHHITLQPTDIHQARTVVAEHAIPYFRFKHDDPFWMELFIHHRDAFGVLIQITEFNADDFLASSETLASGRKWAFSATDRGCRLTAAHTGGAKAANFTI